ncbi:MAG: bifunctional phosphopantothenoylcysteine decarboxylase/phosphopantothenate--cysteine ligase CoaBC [Candidatus Nezhaarchaeota archaeon]|nr:bifunctional phosphopantothenoylcysteine decarboxylase/phosphopantothenate--cysteine ligase CoaBC [Candidatus Nezhaarchaeota archaeon]
MSSLYHPVDEIRRLRGEELNGANIALCVTGSAAAYKAVDLARELIKRGANVVFVATPRALQFVTPTLLHWASGIEPVTSGGGKTEHVTLASKGGWAHAVVVAPATANTICKLACGISDNVVMDVLTTAMGSGKPIVVAPAMHADMYRAPTVQRSLQELRGLGVMVVDPEVDGERLRMASTDEVADVVEDSLDPIDGLKGLSVLVTAGPTREHLDPVRFISNASSGKMGYAVASVCANNGAKVQLVSGPTELRHPRNVAVKSVVSTHEMLEACISSVEEKEPDIIVLAAAPADFSFSDVFADKVSSDRSIEVTLRPTGKIALELRKRAPRAVIVGFKAEYGVPDDELLRRARERMSKYGFDLVLANNVARSGVGFGSEFNEGYLLSKRGERIIRKARKRLIARIIVREALNVLRDRQLRATP